LEHIADDSHAVVFGLHPNLRIALDVRQKVVDRLDHRKHVSPSVLEELVRGV